MAITVRELLVRAFYLTGIFSPQTKPIEHELDEALFSLNELLDANSGDSLLVPFWKKLTFTLTPGVDSYTVGPSGAMITSNKIIDIVSANLIRQNVAYPLTVIESEELYDNSRYLLNQSMPGYIMLQNAASVSTVQFYPSPSLADTVLLIAKFTLSDLKLDDLLTELPDYYLRYLRFALGKELNVIYNTNNWSREKEDFYIDALKTVKRANNVDLSIRLSNTPSMSALERGLSGI